jgi:hypothetical protein
MGGKHGKHGKRKSARQRMVAARSRNHGAVPHGDLRAISVAGDAGVRRGEADAASGGSQGMTQALGAVPGFSRRSAPTFGLKQEDHFNDQGKAGAAGAREKIHEKITADIIKKDRELVRILPEEQREQIIRVIEGNQRSRDYRHDIVSSALDADKMDYLLRDAYFAGVE